MPPTVDDHLWRKATLLTKLYLLMSKIPFLRQKLVRKIYDDLRQENLYVKCSGLESDRNPDAERKTSIYPVIIDKPDFAKIRQACKAKQVSVYSAIQTAASQAICEMIVQEASKRRIPIVKLKQPVAAAATVNRDDVMRNNQSFLGTFSYLIPHSIDVTASCDSDTFWQRAQAAHNNIRTNMAASQLDLLYLLAVTQGCVKTLFNTRQPTLIEVTNLGNCNYLNRERAAGLKITAHFSSAAEHRAGPIFTNSTTAIDDKLCWSVGYFHNVTTKETAVRYLHRSVEILLESCQN